MKGRVLIMDDEAEIRRNLSVGLVQEGYSVVTCPDGISAIHEIERAARKGEGFDYLVTDIFMPDIDGLKILKVLKTLYPNLPVLVITAFGDEKLKYTALAEPNTAYLDKPFEIGDLVRALETLSPGPAVGPIPPAETPEPTLRESVSAYLTVRITQPERSLAIFDQLRQLEGVQSCDAVVGDVDIILLAQASSLDGIRGLFEKVRAVPGVEVVSMSPVERPKLDRDVRRFVEIYEREAKRRARAEVGRHAGATSYLILDIDPAAIQQVFATVFFMDEVVFCDVTDGGRKLVGMVTGLDTGEQIRKLMERLSRVEGVLRVREAKIIRMTDE